MKNTLQAATVARLNIATTPKTSTRPQAEFINIKLENIMAWEFSPLVERMVDKLGWNEADAVEAFQDLKRFLYLAAIAENPIAPSEKIDAIWHEALLFTEDYSQACQKYFGKFIHHRPRRRNDPPAKRNLRLETLTLAVNVFGLLSNNWQYSVPEKMPLRADCLSCAPGSCESCSPSTNCQS